MICPLYMMALAVVSHAGAAGIALHDFVPPPAPFQATMRENQLAWSYGDGVPASLTIHNDGSVDDRLLGASSPIASCVGIQRTQFVHGRPQIVPLPDGLVVSAGATITLEPAAGHLALFGLRSDLVQGQSFPLTLYFDRAGEVEVTARVRRKLDAAGITPLPPVSAGDLTVTGVSAMPAPAEIPVS